MIKEIINSICPLSKNSIAEIESLLQIEDIKKGETFIKLNKRNKKEYFLLDGICRSYLLNPEGEEINISLYTSKSILSPFTTRTKDEISVINFQALTDVNIVSINAFEFEKLMAKNLEIRNFGNIVLRNELAIKVDKEIGLASLTAKERFIKFSEQFPLLENLKMLLLMVFIICLTSCNNQNNKFATTKDNKIENLDSLIRNDRKSFLTKLTVGIESDEKKAHLIVNWLAVNFDWKATDYKKRSVQQIIDRGGGNCNDLAKVAISLMDAAAIKIRKVKEINIHTKSNERLKSAAILVNEKGFKYSVFGMMHNDHVWLEIYDKHKKEWIPADPSLGITGLENWMKSRVTFDKIETLDSGSKDMIVPIAVFAQDENDKFTINRTEYYLIECFDKAYNNKLSNSPTWIDWSSRIKEIDDKCLLAFEGKLNLHLHQDEIKALSDLYGNMKIDFENNK